MVSISKISKYASAFLLALMLVFSAGKATASHFAAADLYVDYIGTGETDLSYRVTLILFKACEPNSTNLTTTTTVSYSSANAPFNGNINMTNPKIDTLDQLCANFAPINSCRVPTSQWPAFVRHIWTNTVTLPSRQRDWIFSWTSGARNGGILNLQAPSSQNLYIECSFDNVFRYNNSSPRFLIDPLPYLCVNQPAVYLNGPLDPNNDSVSVLNQQPLDNNATSPIPYAAGYTLANPIASAPTPYILNPLTGTATFTPSLQGKFVLAFRGEEYDRSTGNKVGHIMRDVQVSVLSCSSAPPSIDSVPSNIIGGIWQPINGTSAITICPDQKLSFDIGAKSQTISNSVLLESNAGISGVTPGAVFSVVGNGTANPIGTFSWTPGPLDVGDHVIIITAKDSTCDNNQPIVLKNYFTVVIKVLPAVYAGPDQKICPVDPDPVQLTGIVPNGLAPTWTIVSGGTPNSLSSTTILNPIASPKTTTSYILSVQNIGSNCKNRDTVTVALDTSNMVRTYPLDPAVLCRPNYFQLEAITKGKSPIEPLVCGTIDTANCSTQQLEFTDVYDKTNTGDQIKVIFPPTNELNSGSSWRGWSHPTPFSPKFRAQKTQFLIRAEDLVGAYSGTIQRVEFFVNSQPIPGFQFRNFTISLKCVPSTYDQLGPDQGFETGMTPVYYAPSQAIGSNWNKFTFTTPYNWDGKSNLIMEFCYQHNTDTLPVDVTNINNVSLNYVNTYYPSVKYARTVDSNLNLCDNIATADSSNVPINFRPLFRFGYCVRPKPFEFLWNPGDFLSDSTSQTPLAYIPKSTTYTVATEGRNGCKLQDTINIYVPEHNFEIGPIDTAICYGNSAPLWTKTNSSSPHSYRWYEYNKDNKTFSPVTSLYNPDRTTDVCGTCANPIAKPEKTTTYAVVMQDSVYCEDTLFVNVIVKPLPDVRILNEDTTVKYGRELQLLASGARLYSWEPISTLSNPNVANPIATPREPVTYIVHGIGKNGCRNTDTVKVNIDYRDNLFVPTGFTPNGDGKNDEFKVVNLTFQRIIEFRVFNRWGQEIFSTTNNTDGWDGTWKGEPQDIGTYQYLIRVAYPDGLVETYKGDVTLVR